MEEQNSWKKLLQSLPVGICLLQEEKIIFKNDKLQELFDGRHINFTSTLRAKTPEGKFRVSKLQIFEDDKEILLLGGQSVSSKPKNFQLREIEPRRYLMDVDGLI